MMQRALIAAMVTLVFDGTTAPAPPQFSDADCLPDYRRCTWYGYSRKTEVDIVNTPPAPLVRPQTPQAPPSPAPLPRQQPTEPPPGK